MCHTTEEEYTSQVIITEYNPLTKDLTTLLRLLQCPDHNFLLTSLAHVLLTHRWLRQAWKHSSHSPQLWSRPTNSHVPYKAKAVAQRETRSLRLLLFTLGRPKFQTGSPNGGLKLMILRLTSGEQTTKFPAHSALLKWQRKTFDRRSQAKKYFCQWKVNKQHYVLKFTSVTSAAEQLKFLVWKWPQMNLIVLEKPIIKSWLFLQR